MAEQTFDFGYGPVPAHCHKNPNGREGDEYREEYFSTIDYIKLMSNFRRKED